MASTDWPLDRAPLFRLPEDRRTRLAIHEQEAASYARPGGVIVHMPQDHFVVWSSWKTNPDGRLTGQGLPAYVPRETWAKTYGNERPAANGHLWADKTNMVRAARYVGSVAARILVNENDPSRPETWAIFGPGDHVVLAVDDEGNPMTYLDTNGVRRFDQYPIHGANWEHVGWEPVHPLPAGMEPTIDRREGSVVLGPVRNTEPPGSGELAM